MGRGGESNAKALTAPTSQKKKIRDKGVALGKEEEENEVPVFSHSVFFAGEIPGVPCVLRAGQPHLSVNWGTLYNCGATTTARRWP